MNSEILPANFFRHEYGKLIAILTCRFGKQYMDDIEDAVQIALMKATERWPQEGFPREPSAWLFKVAKNNLLDHIKKDSNRTQLQQTKLQQENVFEEPIDPHYSHEVHDEMLKMMFICCHGSLPDNSKLVLALKILCGFSIKEIALRLFAKEDSIQKRYSRAKEVLKHEKENLMELSFIHLKERASNVKEVLYLLFTEGYLSSHSEEAIRKELCDEAIRLTTILAEHPSGNDPDTFALLALMYFHVARLPSRQDENGQLLLLQEQNRCLWNKQTIQQGMQWLTKSAHGAQISRYHAEAAIAAEHCMAPSLAETRWEHIIHYYQLLESLNPSPVHRLNRVVAMAEAGKNMEGLEILQSIQAPKWLQDTFLWNVVHADIYFRCKLENEALTYLAIANKLAPSEEVKKLLKRRFKAS